MICAAMTHTFPRSICACDADRANCKRQPGPLAPGDADAIAAHLGARLVDVPLVRSPGAVLRTGDGQIVRVGTITPGTVPGTNGRCVFLDDRERCTIHAAAPFGCAYYDVHLNETEVHARGVALYLAIVLDDTYTRLRASLPPAMSHRPFINYPTYDTETTK